MTDLPIACTLLEADLQQRRRDLLDRVFARVQETRPQDDGYAIRFEADDAALAELLQLVRLERQCCAFMRFRLTVEPADGPVWLELTGPEGTKSFLESILGLGATS